MDDLETWVRSLPAGVTPKLREAYEFYQQHYGQAPQLDPRGAEQWRPIETAPMHTDVIVAFSTIVGEARCLATSAGPQWFWANTDPSDHWVNAIYPTHWQPLPPPPIAAADRSHP